MYIIAVAKDEQLLYDLSDAIKSVFSEGQVGLFIDPLWAVKYAYENLAELAFVFTEINRVDCFQVESTLIKSIPKIKVVFIADNEEDAANIEALGSLCICMPVTEDAIRAVVFKNAKEINIQ